MKYILWIALIFLFAASPAMGSEPDVVILKGKALISSEKVLLKDVAMIEGPGKNDLASIYIMKSPVNIIGVSLSSKYIAQKIHAQYNGPVVLRGARKVHVSPKLLEIERSTIESIYRKGVLEKSPWRNTGKILIEDFKIPRTVRVLEKDRNRIQAKFSPHEDFLGLTTLTLVFGSGTSAAKFHASARIRLIAEVPVMKSSIKRWSIITEKDLEIRPLDISTYAQVVMNKKECVGMRTKTSLRKGRPILKTNIEEPPLISRGDIIFIEAKARNLIVRDKGVALSDGHLTQRIPVRNASSGKQVVGTIIADSRIEVDF